MGSSTGAGSAMGATHTSLSTTASKRQGEINKADCGDAVLDIMQRAETMPKKQPFQPGLQPIIGGKGSTVPRIGGGPVKATAQGTGHAVANTSGGIVVGQGLGIGKQGSATGAFESNKPVKATSNKKEKTTAANQEPDNDKQSLSLLVQNRSEESKREEANRFDESKTQEL